MTTWLKALRVIIRLVFVGAAIAFLYASIHHISFFYDNFEPSVSRSVGIFGGFFGLTGSDMLALALDVTSLMLTISVMEFGASMPTGAKRIVWAFIFFLTGYSWFINWQYAYHFQRPDLTTDPVLLFIDPIIASSFAALNLAYAYVSEFFNLKQKTIEDLQKELAEKTQRETLEAQLKGNKKSIFERVKEAVIAGQNAANEIAQNAAKLEVKPEPKTDEIEPAKAEVLPPENDPKTDEIDASKIAALPSEAEPENEEVGAINEPDAEPSKNELDAVLAVYPGLANILTPNTKSVSIDELVNATKHSRVKIVNRIEKGILKTTPRNKELVLLPSVLDWLKTEPKPKGNTDKMHVVKPDIRYVS